MTPPDDTSAPETSPEQTPDPGGPEAPASSSDEDSDGDRPASIRDLLTGRSYTAPNPCDDNGGGLAAVDYSASELRVLARAGVGVSARFATPDDLAAFPPEPSPEERRAIFAQVESIPRCPDPTDPSIPHMGDALAALDPALLLVLRKRCAGGKSDSPYLIGAPELLGLLDAIDQLAHDLRNAWAAAQGQSELYTEAKAEIAALLERPWFLDPPRDLDAETCAGWIIGKVEAAARARQPHGVVVLPARVEALLAGTSIPAYGFASYRLLDVVHVRTQPTAIRFATC